MALILFLWSEFAKEGLLVSKFTVVHRQVTLGWLFSIGSLWRVCALM